MNSTFGILWSWFFAPKFACSEGRTSLRNVLGLLQNISPKFCSSIFSQISSLGNSQCPTCEDFLLLAIAVRIPRSLRIVELVILNPRSHQQELCGPAFCLYTSLSLQKTNKRDYVPFYHASIILTNLNIQMNGSSCSSWFVHLRFEIHFCCK